MIFYVSFRNLSFILKWKLLDVKSEFNLFTAMSQYLPQADFFAHSDFKNIQTVSAFHSLFRKIDICPVKTSMWASARILIFLRIDKKSFHFLGPWAESTSLPKCYWGFCGKGPSAAEHLCSIQSPKYTSVNANTIWWEGRRVSPPRVDELEWSS